MTDTRFNRAAEWFVRLRAARITTDDITAWLAWCQEHPDNERAYRQVQEMWTLTGDAGVTDWPTAERVQADPYQGHIPISEWNAQQSSTPRRPHRLRPALALAASLLVAVSLWFFRDVLLPAPDSGTFSTERGGQRTVRLADGSQVTLGGASTVRVDYVESRRNVALERGEAFFKVARDPTRPFVVQAQNVSVTAIGTAFTVRADDDRTTVSVSEGVVEVVPTAGASTAATTPGSAASEKTLRARAGEQIIYDATDRATELKSIDTATALGWQDGALTSFDEPLRTVVARVNRYSDREIVMDESLGELRFTGTVFEHQIPEWARGLERVFPIRVVSRDDGRLALEPRQPQESTDAPASRGN